MKEISDFGRMVQSPRKGDPVYDLIGMIKYCDEHNIDRSNGVPQEIAEKFVIGRH